MKNASKAILKLLKDKVNSRCQNDKTREDAEQKPLSMTPCFNKGFTLIELLVVFFIANCTFMIVFMWKGI